MRKTLLSLGIATLAFVAAIAQAQQAPIDLPDLGNPADLAISPKEEEEISRQVAAELYYFNYVLEDVEVGEYLNTLGWRLAAFGTEKPPEFRFFMIADPRINAFALPGGYIGMNAGLILAAGTESEVASVMAHEQAHVTQRHAARGQDQGEVETIATWLAVLAAIIAGSANPNVVIGALSLGQGINYNRQVSYTRTNEYEADRVGIRTLAAAGFDPNGMAGFFAKLEQQTRLYGNRLPEILLTHPVNTTRIAEASARAAQYQKREVKNSIDFDLMRARIRVLMSETPSEIGAYFEGELNGGKVTAENQYGLAMALAAQGRYEEADAAIAPLVKANLKSASVPILEARILIGSERTGQGLALLKKTLDALPRHPPTILAYAEALINAGEPAEARRVLLSHEQALGTRIETYRLLSSAAKAQGNIAEAQYQQGVYHYERGDIRSALQQLNAGLRVAGISTADRSRLSAKRQEILEEIPKDQLRRLQRE
ncbi:M48 family metalloprotease [Nevskia sp.]|uniref:M48 family metalloprotease n=1 Tax=Nevskia sp. TaxID=1929292 RepID=UPI0025CE5FDA|nr:M48 family metalloprotease [Nevskia sp.]